MVGAYTKRYGNESYAWSDWGYVCLTEPWIVDRLIRARSRIDHTGIETEQENNAYDTVVFPGHEDGFRQAFLGENKWYHPRVRDDRIPFLKYIAIYVGKPVSAITHYAKIASFEPVELDGKKRYKVHLDGEAVALANPVPLGGASPAATRAPRYTTLAKLQDAQQYGDL